MRDSANPKKHDKAHPEHDKELARLRKIEGQVRGVTKMVEDTRYCVEILTQLKAIKSALSSVEANILESHLNHCVQKAFKNPNDEETVKVVKEIKDLLKKS